MSRPRRPSVSIHDYPEDLNPFNDGSRSTTQSSASVELRRGKEPKNKFWTFGRGKKKRSNSFSVKSAWSGLFGKRKESEAAEIAERRTTISTVSTSYQNGQFGRPVPPPRSSRDQQEFEEAFGTFTRRKKYSMETSSTYGSNLTVNGDPARLYNGSPQDTTASILGELTPKPPARRFGQVSPRPKDDIPPFEFQATEANRSSSPNDVNLRVSEEEAPIPLRRSGRKPIPRVNVLETSEEEDREMATNLPIRDENENLADDFVFRRCSQDAVRRSNLSINSCVSTASGYSTSGRRKRRAPQPPQRKETAENSDENSSSSPPKHNGFPTRESIDIAKVTEDIREMTKQSQIIDEASVVSTAATATTATTVTAFTEGNQQASAEANDIVVRKMATKDEKEEGKENEKKDGPTDEETGKVQLVTEKDKEKPKDGTNTTQRDNVEVIETIEINRMVEENLEIIKDMNENSDDSDEVEIRKKPSNSSSLVRSGSFSVKEQIEQIERQIKELESQNANNTAINNNNNTNNSNNNNNNDNSNNNDDNNNNNNNNNDNNNDNDNDNDNNDTTDCIASSNVESKYYEPSESRLSIQANRRSFFKNMVSSDSNGLKIEIKELPREQKQIQVVKLSDSPVPIPTIKEPIKIVELHISEPIKQVPEILEDINVNPLPKPRRNSSVTARSILNGDKKNSYDDSNDRARDTMGDSL